jgi:transcriptional regulator with XRE-family HTH domain
VQIYEFIESILVKKGISDRQMMQDSGLKRGVLDNMKKGSMPAADKIAAIAKYLGVSVDYLLGTEQDLKSRAADIKRRVMEESNEKKFFRAAPIDMEQKRSMSELHSLLSEMSSEDLKKMESYAAFLISEKEKEPPAGSGE